MTVYLDASIIIPTLVQEASTAIIQVYLSREPERLISDFAAVEVASGLSRLVAMGLLSDQQADIRLTDFEAWRSTTSTPVEVHAADLRVAHAYVRRFELMLRAPDALHLAIAHRLATTLVTRDWRLVNAARELGVAVAVPGTDTPADPR